MITTKNLEDLLITLEFEKEGNTYQKTLGDSDSLIQPTLKVDLDNEKITYPEGLKVHREDICNHSQNENFVVFECVHRLLEKGYKPEHLELERPYKVGHGASGGRTDILVKDQENNPLLLIECKTAGDEFERAWRKTQQNGDQLFSYAQQIPQTQYLCLYASDLVEGEDTENYIIKLDQRIIAHRDNDRILQQNENLRSFAEATDVEDRYNIWCDTYEQEYTETGIFEDNIQSYNIGKDKYTLEEDTKPIDATDADKDKGQYHKFRTILRQHNIARREQAFEVLVNLFLSKLVDEEENTDNLQFSWKGIAYDDYFDFVDRLQNLYKTGMDKFLRKDISYISNEEIDNAFWAVKNDANATKKQIQTYFRKLKFFTNSAFSLHDTHNEELFKRNAKVLLKIVQMWQKIRIKTDTPNQFLGDMFELFLDDGVKQSNGQFFTPLPICKFIVSSLPLQQKINDNPDPLKVIDYACGSGHFLNEYAHQIKPILESQNSDPTDYYAHITGIEKEDRLAKVTKVAAYMHAQGEIEILDIDALAEHTEVKKEYYDVLIANPPFAVEGFLQTLSKDDKQHYQLIKATGEDSDTNTIQCFFLERIHHLMTSNGVVGVVVPSSILSNADAVHIQTREILIKYFDIVSIAQLGSGTFGKTGTNTVVLFLKRKQQRPEPAEQYQNRVNNYFEGDEENQYYQDNNLIEAYCKQIEIPYEEYIKLFNQTSLEPLTELLKHDIFKDYEKDFNPDKVLQDIQNTKDHRDKTEEEQHEELGRRFIAYLHEKEKDKLYYFMLACTQACQVLIVNAPTKKNEQKQFLGYEWSTRKGSEGIQYTGGNTVNHIITPLFDPKDLHNHTKINTAIRRNFTDDPTDDLPDHCHYANLTDMLDFTRTKFNKTISLNPYQKIDIETKWDKVKLGDIVDSINGLWKGENEPFSTVNVIRNTNFAGDGKIDLSDVAILEVETNKYNSRKLRNGDIIVEKSGGSSTQAVGRVVYFDIDEGEYSFSNFTSRLRVKDNNIKPKYLMLLLNYIYAKGYTFNLQYGISGIRNLDFDRYLEIEIPNPPPAEQTKIINECEAVDQETDQAHQTITTSEQQIEELVSSVENTSRLDQVVDKISDIVDPKEENGIVNYIGLENIESQTGILLGDIQTDYSTIKSNKNVFCIGDILYGKLRPNLNKVYLADFDGICSTDILVLRPKNPNLATFYKHYFLSEVFNSEVLTTVSGQQLPRTSWEKINRIPVPPLNTQQQLVAEIEQLEAKITEAQTIIDNAKDRKNAILENHLK